MVRDTKKGLDFGSGPPIGIYNGFEVYKNSYKDFVLCSFFFFGWTSLGKS